MPWIAEVRLFSDGEDDNRAHATLIWDEGGLNEFRHTKPIAEISVAAAEQMLAEAIAARAVAAVRRTKEDNLATQLAAIANS